MPKLRRTQIADRITLLQAELEEADSELTDDTLWPQPPVGSDRRAYARNLRNARVDHNDTTLNGSDAALHWIKSQTQ